MPPCTRRALFPALILLALLSVAACGPSSTDTSSALSTASATNTLLPTATSAWTGTATPTTTCADTLTGMPNVTQQGDVVVQADFDQTFPARKLPDDTPLKPFQISASDQTTLDQQLPPDPAVNPDLMDPAGYAGVVCNASTTTHMLTDLTVRIDSFTPASAVPNAWRPCEGYYARPAGVQGNSSGCTGGFPSPNCRRAAFVPSAGAGAVISTTSTCKGPPLPAALHASDPYGYDFNLGIVAPIAPGTYTFSLGIAFDGAAPVYFSLPHPILLAPVTHMWDAQSCTTPAMQSQIPSATNPPTDYICPKS